MDAGERGWCLPPAAWCWGNGVGAFWHASYAPAAEFRREAWERGEWDASWYCIDCYAEHWACSEAQAREYFGFTARQARKNQYMQRPSPQNAPASPVRGKVPADMSDSRFHKTRELRQVRCDSCRHGVLGNAAGAYHQRHCMPPAADRESEWPRGSCTRGHRDSQ